MRDDSQDNKDPKPGTGANYSDEGKNDEPSNQAGSAKFKVGDYASYKHAESESGYRRSEVIAVSADSAEATVIGYDGSNRSYPMDVLKTDAEVAAIVQQQKA